MPSEVKTIQIKWGSVENLPALYANQLFISHGGENEFYLIIGHLSPPIGSSVSDYPDELEIKPIAQLVLSPETMRTFVNAMGENLRKYEDKKDNGGEA